MLDSTTTQIQNSKPGSIILINLQQADGRYKQRPAIVMKQMPGYGDLLVCGISSQLRREMLGFDEVIMPDANNGLRVQSVVRLGFLQVVPTYQIVGRIGCISDTLLTTLLQRLSDYLIQISVST